MSDITKVRDLLSCSICKNLIRRPKCCMDCDSHFCELCIKTDSDGCPKCDRIPRLKEANRTLHNLLCKVKVTCNFCNDEFVYD